MKSTVVFTGYAKVGDESVIVSVARAHNEFTCLLSRSKTRLESQPALDGIDRCLGQWSCCGRRWRLSRSGCWICTNSKPVGRG